MSTHTIQFTFGLVDEPDNYHEEQRLRDEFSAAIKPKLDQLDASDESSDFIPACILTERTCRGLLALLKDVTADGLMRLDWVSISETVDPADGSAAEWFIIKPETFMDIDGGAGGLIDVRADRVKGRKALRRYSGAILVSAKFKELVERDKLTGIDMIWARDRGKYAAPQWYTAFGTESLGRGVDHPWFDPTTRGEFKEESHRIVQPADPQWRLGVRRFATSQVRSNLETDPSALYGLLQWLGQVRNKDNCHVEASVRVLRGFLPNTDFAYMRTAQPEDPMDDPYGTIWLCASAATRTCLIERRLATAKDFMPVIVLDEPPEGAEVLDDPIRPIGGLLDEKAMAKLRKAEAKAMEKFAAKPKPERPVKPPEIKKLIPKLKRRLKKEGEKPAKGATPEQLDQVEAELGQTLPLRWRELLEAVNGFIIDDCAALDGVAELRVAASNQIAEYHELNRGWLTDAEIDSPAGYLGVGSSDLGDPIFLDTAQLTEDGDCPVIHIDHETLETEMTWPAIGLFMSDALDPSGD